MAATKQTLGAEERRERTLMFLTPIVSVLLALVVGAIIIACGSDLHEWHNDGHTVSS